MGPPESGWTMCSPQWVCHEGPGGVVQRRSTLGPLLGDPSGKGTPGLHKAARGLLPSRPEDQALQRGATKPRA